MNRQNLDLLGLTEPVTKEEITQAYEDARAKYMEERFEEGEVGNNAARMLTKIETAYNDLMAELAEQEMGTEAGSGAAYDNVEELIRKGDIQGAQHALDAFTARNGRWHYLQSVVFYRKNWINESRKQLEIAIQLEPDNAKYKETLRRFSDKVKADQQKQNVSGANSFDNGANGEAGAETENDAGAYSGQNMNQQRNEQMGGDMCTSCLEACQCAMCMNCLCGGCR